MKRVNYLDITFNLNDSTYRPYQKENNEINYIHKESNHPPSIIKQLPLSIESRLSRLSSNENIFKNAIPVYDEALKRSGYTHELKYQPPKPNQNKNNNKKRKRNIIWFNPPYSQNVTTKIGKVFLELIDKHFPEHNKLSKLFNRNTVKVSYSCTQNIKSIINSHNQKILNPKENESNQRNCNCIKKEKCPLQQNCLMKNIVYKATVTSDIPNYKRKRYLGSCETTFKLRFGNHKRSFNHKRYKNDTELSNEIWKIKQANGTPHITWEIIRKCAPYNKEARRCNLCLNEKYEIANYKGNDLLNKRNEIISKCRHRNKFALARYDTKD